MFLTVENILDEVIKVDDRSPEITVRQYALKLALLVWQDEEGFSGKRPFGNSGWKMDVCSLLAEKYGLDEYDASHMISDMIAEALKKESS